MDLKQTYEGLLAEAGGSPARASSGRKGLVKRLKDELRPLEHFDVAMQGSPRHVGIPLRQLLRRGIELRAELPGLSPFERERLPDYATWWRHRERIASLTALVEDIRRDGILAKHPLRHLSPRLAQIDHPLELITGVLQAAEKQLEAVEASLGRCGVPREQWQTLATARLLTDYAKQVLPVASMGRMDLLDPDCQTARQFAEAEQTFRRQQEAVAQARQATGAWRHKLPAAEVPVAIAQAKTFEQTFFAWLRPAWWRLRRILNSSYDFRSHVVRPALVAGACGTRNGVRGTRQTGPAAKDDRRAVPRRRKCRGTDCPRPALASGDSGAGPLARADPRCVGEGRQGPPVRRQDRRSRRAAPRLAAGLDEIMHQHSEMSLDQLRAELKQVPAALGDLPAFLQCLSEIATLPPALGTALCTLPLQPSQIEAATADRSLADAYRMDRQLANFTVGVRDRQAGRLERLYGQWLTSNAGELRTRVKRRFLDNVRIANLPAAQLGDGEKELIPESRASSPTPDHSDRRRPARVLPPHTSAAMPCIGDTPPHIRAR